MAKNRKIKLKGYIAVSKYRDVDYYLTGTKWLDKVTELKISDIYAFPRELDMTTWPMMDKTYNNTEITITIDLT